MAGKFHVGGAARLGGLVTLLRGAGIIAILFSAPSCAFSISSVCQEARAGLTRTHAGLSLAAKAARGDVKKKSHETACEDSAGVIEEGARLLENRQENLLHPSIIVSVLAMGLTMSPFNTLTAIETGGVAWADEWGKETEAPTLFTGETVMICKKRGPLGACLETTVRTAQNDNDKATKYFKDPSETVKRKQEQMLSSASDESEGNVLIQKLRMQSEQNKEKNELEVRQKTLLNDQSASFGPFDRQVVILNTDGKTFTLLQNPQAMRLKKAGYIEDRKFIIQPSQDVIDEALEGKNDLRAVVMNFFTGESVDATD